MQKKRGGRDEPVLPRSLTSDPDFKQLKNLYCKLKGKYGLQSSALFQKIEEKDVLIPVTIFNRELSGLEAICKYLRENLSLPNKDVAKLLNRSEKTIWQAYQSSKEKFPSPYTIPETQYTVHVSALHSRTLSVLETIVKHLKESFNLSYHAIAQLLMRDDRTIWTVYQRALKKTHG